MRAQRSNPDCLRGKILDCFAALAMTEYVAAASQQLRGHHGLSFPPRETALHPVGPNLRPSRLGL
ncbi:hypothetical protein DCG74_27615 [Bradyrhizobium sp. WBAH42]|nr:hypothetical protein DAA51_27790 [Bradyrhizobium sp. WBAH10]QCJ84542.1 hypothetical protein DAA53_27965 [Bradyrhizobium sp. WBAH23]QCJ91910.1 hypothetical protein DAA57_28040 [Bradyrhizobium yuanmingense]QCJ99302.1 hypothetical protein DAA61_27920 [Bradyrhizobium sp. WBAH33]QCK06671.1 hypothetical protein DAB18_27960 [Bradyrhizobium sp. WBAH41]UUO30751.1 hypothetical protein DCG74_27615 [Bradyrhizobium sp. WBAH42]